jgi:ABC-type sugar transport system permease subunit
LTLVRGILFVAPWAASFLFFTALPTFFVIFISLTDYNLLREPRWIGLANYVRLLSDPKFGRSILVTITYVGIAVPLKIAVALFVALLLRQKTRINQRLLIGLYVPSVVGGMVATALVWKYLFGSIGPASGLLRRLALSTAVSVTGSPRMALGVLVVYSVWQFGTAMLVFLAALRQIPKEQIEVAIIEGASRSQRLRYLLLPAITNALKFNVVVQIILAATAFNGAFLITSGGPLDSTLLLSLYMYRTTFPNLDVGYGSAMSVVLFVSLSLLVLAASRSLARLGDE